MKCNEIYEAAMAHIGKIPYTIGTESYESRAPYLLCAICYELGKLDSRYREAMGEESAKAWDGLSLPLSSEFPLSARLSSAVTYCLASSLVANENAKLSDEFYMRYNQSTNDILSEIPGEITETINVYPD